MDAGSIDYGQIVLDRATQAGGIQQLLSVAADEIEKLGPVTIFDFTVQSLAIWQGNPRLHGGVFFTYRKDDLITSSKHKTRAKITTQILAAASEKIVKIEIEDVSGPYEYGSLLRQCAKVCKEYDHMNLASVYFDHRYTADQKQYPFFVLVFLPKK